MINRIFSFEDLPTTCIIDVPGGDTLNGRVLRMSHQKAVVDATASFKGGESLVVALEFGSGNTAVLNGEVVQCDTNGMFLRWVHTDEKAAKALMSTLVEAAAAWAEKSPEEKAERLGTSMPGATGATPSLAQASAQAADSDAPNDVLRSSIISRTRTVQSSQLAKTVRVLDMSTIANLIQDAVDEVIGSRDRSWSDDERKRLLEEAEDNFKERLQAVQAEKKSVEHQVETLAQQLKKAQEVLAHEQARVVESDQFTVSHEGIEELDRRFRRLLDSACKENGISGPLEDEMRAAVAKLLDDERERNSQKAKDAQSESIELLERKIGRLARSLEETQRERDVAEYRAQALEASGGGGAVVNKYMPGLDGADPNKEKKLGLLKELVAVNKEVRGHLIKSGADLTGRARPTQTTKGDATEGQPASTGVKKVSVKNVQAPPLERTKA